MLALISDHGARSILDEEPQTHLTEQGARLLFPVTILTLKVPPGGGHPIPGAAGVEGVAEGPPGFAHSFN